MAGKAYDPTLKLQVHVVSQSPHTFAYKLWHAKATDATWSALDAGTIQTPEKEYGPFDADHRFAYTLIVAGNPNTNWQVQVMLSQAGGTLQCEPPAETGITSAKGAARRDTGLVLQ